MGEFLNEEFRVFVGRGRIVSGLKMLNVIFYIEVKKEVFLEVGREIVLLLLRWSK